MPDEAARAVGESRLVEFGGVVPFAVFDTVAPAARSSLPDNASRGVVTDIAPNDIERLLQESR